MSDFDRFIEMLTRARIAYRVSDTLGSAEPSLPEGARSILVGDCLRDYRPGGDPTPPQPYLGGYPGFFTEFVFDGDGALIAVWGWE